MENYLLTKHNFMEEETLTPDEDIPEDDEVERVAPEEEEEEEEEEA